MLAQSLTKHFAYSNRYQPGPEVGRHGASKTKNIGSHSVTGLIIGLHSYYELYLFCTKSGKDKWPDPPIAIMRHQF